MNRRHLLSALAIVFAASATAFGEDAAAFRACTLLDRQMEIGNYDVEIDLGPGPSTNFVKFAGRRIAVDRTELAAGEKKTVSFTARVPGPYTTKKGDEWSNRKLKIELFTNTPEGGEESAPRVTPNASARTIITGTSI